MAARRMPVFGILSDVKERDDQLKFVDQLELIFFIVFIGGYPKAYSLPEEL